MNVVVPNPEEAANVAAEFIYSIDNLPGEVAHLLQEIKHREARTQELQHEIDKDAMRYIKHSRRASSASSAMPMTTMTSMSGSSTPLPESPSSSRAHSVAPQPNGTPIPIPTKISASYTEIHELAAEKCALAERLIEIITRTRAKLDVDIAKVRLLQGDPPELVAAQASATANMKPAGLVALSSVPLTPVGSIAAEPFGAPGRNPALAISESLRIALANQPLVEGNGGRGAGSGAASGTTTPTGTSGHATKKRRTTTTTSIKISPAASPTKHRSTSPAAIGVAVHAQPKSRLSRQIHPPPPPEDTDMDADGDEEEEGDMEEDNEDETLYCFCRKRSYGDMIACDNEVNCPYEWFHLACVGLKQPTPEKWFCSVCSKEKGITSTTTTTARKGRKK